MSTKANSRCSMNVYSSMAKVNVSNVNPLKHMPIYRAYILSFRLLYLLLHTSASLEISFPLILRREMPEM